jgi:IS5 family transposase
MRILKKRASIEALISHIKRNSRMGRNYLKGHEGNEANAVGLATGLAIIK